jgi:acetylglutamate kinase
VSAKTESRGAIVRLLELMRDGREVRQYLQRFSQLDQSRFAVIKVGGAVLRDHMGTLADALAFLQSVGLTPVVVHGGGPQLDEALKAAGVASERRDGLRVTTPEVLKVAREVFVDANIRLVDAIRQAGARAAAIPRGVFEAELAQDGALGLVGEPVKARLELIESAARAGAVPVLTSLGELDDGRLVNVNADAAVRTLVHALQPYKIIFLTETGGVLDGEGKVISAINLATDAEELFAQPWLQGGMRLKIEEIARLLEDLPLTSSVSITTPDGLAQELFTYGGAPQGTLVRLGERIDVYEDKSKLDRARSEALVEAAFGRAPTPDWWDGFDLARVYMTENYRAGAFVARLGEVGYLDKFAVESEARGEGLARAVWRRMTADWPKLVWRSRSDNPINEFYFRESDGCARKGVWTVFWIGFDAPGDAHPWVEKVAALPATLEERAK